MPTRFFRWEEERCELAWERALAPLVCCSSLLIAVGACDRRRRPPLGRPPLEHSRAAQALLLLLLLQCAAAEDGACGQAAGSEASTSPTSELRAPTLLRPPLRGARALPLRAGVCTGGGTGHAASTLARENASLMVHTCAPRVVAHSAAALRL